LLRLPAELRNKIHAYAIGGHVIVPCAERPHTHFPAYSKSGIGPNDLCALSLVCRQTAFETRGLIYQLNVFAF
ncbi:hypothetical protein K491DRAFT_563342, partial [Lophiostoma macrostomum CBS 122681]